MGSDVCHVSANGDCYKWNPFSQSYVLQVVKEKKKKKKSILFCLSGFSWIFAIHLRLNFNFFFFFYNNCIDIYQTPTIGLEWIIDLYL